jgi:hypothetical protein
MQCHAPYGVIGVMSENVQCLCFQESRCNKMLTYVRRLYSGTINSLYGRLFNCVTVPTNRKKNMCETLNQIYSRPIFTCTLNW